MEKPDSTAHQENVPTKEVITETTVKLQNPKLAAIIASNKPNPWGSGYLKLYSFCTLLFLCSTMNASNVLPNCNTY
jgi:hypothetical protein